jgi:hypothetical protein
LAPIMAVNAKRATPAANAAMPAPPGHVAASTGSMIGAGGRRRFMTGTRQACATQIAAALKMLVAAEVRAQLDVIRKAAVSREATQPASGDTDPATGPPVEKTPA